MAKKLAAILKYIGFLGLGIFLVWYSLQQISDDKWDAFTLSLQNARYWLFVPVFFILTGSHFTRALRWKELIAPLGYKPKNTNTFFAVMIGYLANLAVPRLGEILKCTVLAKYEAIPAEKTVGTIVAERAVDVVCLGLLFVAALFLEFDVVVEAFKKTKAYSSTNNNGNFLGIALYTNRFIGFLDALAFTKRQMEKPIECLQKNYFGYCRRHHQYWQITQSG
jgi:uncharacterized protein (TIRG00374 family)